MQGLGCSERARWSCCPLVAPALLICRLLNAKVPNFLKKLNSTSPATPPCNIARSVTRVHHYALEITWHRGRGTTTAGPECGSTTPRAPKCVILFSFFFLSSGLRLREALSGSRPAELTMQQPGKKKGQPSIQVVSITSIIPVLCTIPQLTPGGGHVK